MSALVVEQNLNYNQKNMQNLSNQEIKKLMDSERMSQLASAERIIGVWRLLDVCHLREKASQLPTLRV